MCNRNSLPPAINKMALRCNCQGFLMTDLLKSYKISQSSV